MDVLEWTRKACKQLEQELDRTTAARDTLKAELTEVLGELAAANAECVKLREDRAALEIALVHHDTLQDRLLAATAELAAARDELRARDEAIADFDERARWRLEQKPYTGTGEP
jgi:chromosome segregation ATPase